MKILNSIKSIVKERYPALLAAIFFLVFTLSSFGVYYTRTLKGDINNHILSAEMFGVPTELKQKGLEPLYTGNNATGWDGQFYYYMSNDILANKDTSNHIDNPPYRYQRIGMSLFAAIVSFFMGSDWVSPAAFFVTYLVLITIATYAGARLLQKYSAPGYLVLFWALSVGTQVTLFNALPDAAADAFLIIALLALVGKRFAICSIAFLFAGLSREVYILFPLCIYACNSFSTYNSIKRDSNSSSALFVRHFLLKLKGNNYLLLPVIGVVLWQLYISSKFGRLGGADAPGILGFPLKAFTEYMYAALTGNHKIVGSSVFAYFEAACLIMFLLVVALYIYITTNFIYKSRDFGEFLTGLAIAGLILSVLYLSFGPTVMMHYTGYFKALSIFLFLLPLFVYSTGVNIKTKLTVISVLLISFAISTTYQMRVRILPDPGYDEYTKLSYVKADNEIECLKTFDATVQIESIEYIKRDILNISPLVVAKIKLTNTGNKPIVSSRAKGSVHLSYHWVDASGSVVLDGIRTAIPDPVMPGDTIESFIVSPLPDKRSRLIVSPVQEGCAWFYIANPKLNKHISN